MIEIYDEIGYIKEVLKNGPGERWKRDLILLARFYKSEGKKIS